MTSVDGEIFRKSFKNQIEFNLKKSFFFSGFHRKNILITLLEMTKLVLKKYKTEPKS